MNPENPDYQQKRRNPHLEFVGKSNPDVNHLPSMVSGLEVKSPGSTTNLVPSTTKVIFS